MNSFVRLFWRVVIVVGMVLVFASLISIVSLV